MAAYLDLWKLALEGSAWRSRVKLATFVRAEIIVDSTGTQSEIDWANALYANEEAYTDYVVAAVIAEQHDMQVADIESADDATLQGWVDSVVNGYIGKGIWPI